MATMSLARKGTIILGATLALATLSGSAEARWGGCWGCGAFAAGAIAGAAIVLNCDGAATKPFGSSAIPA